MKSELINLRQILAQNIRTMRRSNGYSQQYLAEAAHISTGHINDIEHGRKWVSEKTFLLLADALMVEPWMLLRPADRAGSVEDGARFVSFISLFRERQDALIRSTWKEVTGADTEV